MTAFEFDSARKANHGCIVFTVAKDGKSRLVVIPKDKALQESKYPGWNLGALHGSTIFIGGKDAPDPDRCVTADRIVPGDYFNRGSK